MKDNTINLFTKGEVKTGDKTFTRLVGGFGEDNPMFLIWQASELVNQETRELVQNFERNIENKLIILFPIITLLYIYFIFMY